MTVLWGSVAVYLIKILFFIIGSYFLVIGIWELVKRESRKLYIRYSLLGILLLYLSYTDLILFLSTILFS